MNQTADEPNQADPTRALLRNAISGDHDALGKLLEFHAADVRRAIEGKIDVCWRTMLSEDDVLQQTFIDAFQAIGRFNVDSADAFRNWLITMARNNLRDAVRHLQAAKSGGKQDRIRPGSDESYHRLMQEISADQSTPSLQARREEDNQHLQAAIERLPAAYSRIVQAHDLGGAPAQELALELGCSVGAFYMRRARAHAMLARLLSKLVDT